MCRYIEEVGRILYRDFNEARADQRRRGIDWDSLEVDTEIDAGYTKTLKPHSSTSALPFKQQLPVSKDWFDWPALPDLVSSISFPGVVDQP